MGKLLLNRETGGYGLATALCFWSKAPWLALVYKSTGFTAGASMAGKLIWSSARLGIHPHSSVKIAAPPPLACDRSGGACGCWCPKETADFQQLPGAHPPTPGFPSKLVGGNSKLPYKSFPFRLLWPTGIREMLQCYNFLWMWLPARVVREDRG